MRLWFTSSPVIPYTTEQTVPLGGGWGWGMTDDGGALGCVRSRVVWAVGPEWCARVRGGTITQKDTCPPTNKRLRTGRFKGPLQAFGTFALSERDLWPWDGHGGSIW